MENYIGEIRLFGGTYAPEGWLYCQGQLLNINEYEVLYQLLGTTYGGDGLNTFALPNLSSRVAVGMGQAPGGSSYQQGMTGGSETATLNAGQLPPHQHPVSGGTVNGQTGGTAVASPAGAYFGSLGGPSYVGGAGNGNLAAKAVVGQSTVAGAGAQHNNIQPYQAISYIIAFTGIYPSQG